MIMLTNQTETNIAECHQKGWAFTSLPRARRSSLNFMGKCTFTLCKQTDYGDFAKISLWERRQGDFTLGWTVLDDKKIVSQGTILKCLSDVMDHIEDICISRTGTAESCIATSVQSQHALFSFIIDQQRHASFQRIFASLAGEALAICDSRITD